MASSIHHRTPNIKGYDPRRLPVRQVEYLRTFSSDTPAALKTRQQHDAAGRLMAQWDPRLPIPNLVTVYGLGGVPLKVDSVDAGWRLSLPGLAGEELQHWDQRDSHWRTTYDLQLRVVALEENGQPNVETFTYADASADPAHNLRGQLIEQVDASGKLSLDSYDLLGQPLFDSRTFHDAKAFISRRTFSPLGAALEQTDAVGHRQQSSYDLAGNLTQVQLQLSGHTDWQSVLEDARYNAAGQIVEQRTGNGLTSRWMYDLTDGRLLQQTAQKDQASVLQDFEYQYDRVGNITRILDHVFTPTFFANQRVDGHRDFTYDSLYRLTSASGYDDGPPSDIPGRPQPTDPNDRRNYTQTYQYDHGGNLIKLSHVREGASHTRQMFIDPVSNRGVRWTEGDPDPQFDRLFDRHGNLLALQPGRGLQWNARDQLEWATLVHRDNGPDDAEHCRYSQGARVFKRQETHTTKTSHFHEVRYLPGLEIRTRDNGEELHVITLVGGFGSVRCLHWVTGKPTGIDNDQLRYTLDDHLGSCLMELDQQAQLINHEGYYPFGATAWMAVRSQIEVAYKFIRYSGKEMDVSGLYYYGARYYAPWLQRWISADPAEDVDGLNLYAMVGNNPIVFTDPTGQSLENFIDGFLETSQQRDERKVRSAKGSARPSLSKAVDKHTAIVGLSERRAKEAQRQILNHRSAKAYGASAAIRTALHIGSQAVSYGAGIAIGLGTTALGAAAGPAGVATGAALGIVTKKAVSLGLDFALERSGLSASVKFKAGKLDPQRIVAKGEYKTGSYNSYITNKFKGIVNGVIALNQKGWLKGAKEGTNLGATTGMKLAGTAMSSEISAGFSGALGLPEIVHEVIGAAAKLSPEKIAKADSNISHLIDTLNTNMNNIEAMFGAAGVKAINTYSVVPSKFYTPSGDTVESLRKMTNSAIHELKYTQAMLHSRSSRFTAV
ncbi:RHS repeat-associated core domain-containing protein [Pseudomonas sp. AL03]|uniref:RHS repeat-associated core domain-containing protein n=1 Tax=Pseudomonas sp. AL03 TaxID=3042230 RepID=UPI00249A463A|nr:RHS repeat-associated core domain-containing protein [Pseudomonas sp. AL03]MDI3271259.1 RHS repeat-associated core domain-containing protein [Pseudomonas sp. AL03]